MPDLCERMTDRRIEEIRDKLVSIYTEAAKDLFKKAEEFTKRHEEKDKIMQAKVDEKVISGNDYKKWLKGQVFTGKQWQSKVEQMARSLIHVEENAVKIVENQQIGCFADNANYVQFRIDKDFDFMAKFSVYDENTVTRLIREEPELLRRRVVNGKKCEAWNVKIINNCITQGIIQGESVRKIAKRMARDTANSDMDAMYRYARTAMTGAQNAGRIQAMNNSISKGIRVQKVWITMIDGRQRDAHEELNGDVADVNEPFDSILGPIMFPGDPSADDANVWNCRCALGWEYPDYPSVESEEVEEEELEEWIGEG